MIMVELVSLQKEFSLDLQLSIYFSLPPKGNTNDGFVSRKVSEPRESGVR